MSTPAVFSGSYFQIPIVSTTERNAISSPSSKMIIYNSTTGRFERYYGSLWAGLGVVILPILKSGNSSVGLTSQANAIQDLTNSTIARRKVDLSKKSHFRLIARVAAASVSVNTPRIFVEYSTDDSTYQSIGSSDLSLFSTGSKDTGWVAITSSAIADNIYVRISQDGGNGSSSPSINNAYLMFK